MHVCVRVFVSKSQEKHLITLIELSTPVLLTSFFPTCLVSTFHLAHLASIRKLFVCQVAKARSTLNDVAMCLKSFGTEKSRMVSSQRNHFRTRDITRYVGRL